MKMRTLTPNVAKEQDAYFTWQDRVCERFPFLYDLFRWKANVRSWFLNTFLRKRNRLVLKALHRDEWYDTDTIMFEAVFQLLVNYVEGELAWMELISEGKRRWWHRWIMPKNVRELGLKHLDWEISLGDESPLQSQAAAYIKDLYLWYKYMRPARVDPWSTVPDRDLTFAPVDGKEGLSVITGPSDPTYIAALKTAHDQEAAYEKEDTAKMIEVVNLREYMWT